MTTTDRLHKQKTQITIVAVLDGSEVKLFLANDGLALQDSDRVKDKFKEQTSILGVTVTVLSANDEVSVSNSPDSLGSWSWTPSSGVTVGGATVYYSSATCAMPSKGHVTDKFTIKVGGLTADPTVVITRGGTGAHLVIDSGPKQG